MIHSQKYSRETDGDHKMQHFSLFVPCYSAECAAKDCHKSLGYSVKKSVHGALSALKARLIDKTHDWVTDYPGCFTFGACLVSQEDVETTSYWFYFPCV